MTIQSHYPVLIIGAGPTGMELAAELQRHDIDFLIIDKRPSHVTTSNAAGIHARTLECWYKRPWSQVFSENGLQIKGATLNSKNNRLAFLDFSHLENTPYPFILSIPQNQTEKILDQHLVNVNKAVIRNTTLTNIIHKEDKVTAQLTTPEGDKEITGDWIIGCDGYHSTTRDCAQIEFKGEDIEERFLLVDADLTVDYEHDCFHIYLSPQGLLAFFIMKESTRIIAGVGHDPEFKDVKEPTAEIMSAIIQRRSSLKFKLPSIRWQSHFWIHERVATHFKSGRIFIAGDAAHVHSPAGGQGMNTGIQDAYNLAWKLAYVIKGKAPESLLDSYENERRPIAKSVVNMTSKVTTIASIRNPILVTIRNWLMPRITKQKFFQKEMVGRMSELTLGYANSPIVSGKKINTLSPGDRMPNLLIDQNQYLFDLISNLHHHLFVFHASPEQINYLNGLAHDELFKINYSTQKKFFSDFTLCLIRPDGYIGYLGDHIPDFEKYFISSR